MPNNTWKPFKFYTKACLSWVTHNSVWLRNVSASLTALTFMCVFVCTCGSARVSGKCLHVYACVCSYVCMPCKWCAFAHVCRCGGQKSTSVTSSTILHWIFWSRVSHWTRSSTQARLAGLWAPRFHPVFSTSPPTHATMLGFQMVLEIWAQVTMPPKQTLHNADLTFFFLNWKSFVRPVSQNSFSSLKSQVVDRILSLRSAFLRDNTNPCPTKLGPSHH